MSLVNFSVQPDRVLVAVDTIGGTRKIKIHVNKLFPITHAGMVVCGRGSMAFLAKVVYLCGLLSGIDEAQEFLPRVMHWLLRLTRLQAVLLGQFRAREVFGLQEVYVLGWSERRGEMVALEFKNARGRSRFEPCDDKIEELIAPSLEEGFPALDSVEAMRSVAAKQVRKAMQDDPTIPIGGRLMIADLTREKLTVHCAGEIEIDHLFLYRQSEPPQSNPCQFE